MKKAMKVLSFILFLTVSCNAQEDANDANKAAQPQAFNVGGNSMVLPAPTSDMIETGYDIRESVMELFVPTSNRLIAAFMPPEDLQKLKTDSTNAVLSKYAMVQVLRAGETMDIEASDFNDITAYMNTEFGNSLNSTSKEMEEELNRRLKSLDVNETINLGQPVQLGCLFSKKDAYGFGMIISVSVKDATTKMAAGCCLIRSKKRLMYAYLYTEYKDEETVQWVRKASEKWADAIIAANK